MNTFMPNGVKACGVCFQSASVRRLEACTATGICSEAEGAGVEMIGPGFV